MNSVPTANGRLVTIISLSFFVLINLVWIGIPFFMAILWSLVDPSQPWSYPDIFPPLLSFERWSLLWDTTALPQALINSYSVAPAVAILSLLLSLPGAWAFGRMNFRGKAVAEMLTLIPLIMPGMIIGIFFSAMLISLDISNPFLSIVLGHTVLTLPYSVRIMSASFKSIPQDLIDASRDLGAGRWATFRHACLPMLKPGFLAALIFCLVKSLEEFSISFVLGAPDFITVPTILYSFLGYAFVRPNAAVISMILVIPNVILMIIIEKLLKGNYLSQSTGKA